MRRQLPVVQVRHRLPQHGGRQRLLGRGLGGRQPEVRLFRSSLSRHGAIRLIEVHGVLGRTAITAALSALAETLAQR